MAITIKERAAAAVPTPEADKTTLFVDSADGLPKFKDDTGTLVSLVGPEGPPGAAGADGANGADGADGDMINPMTTAGDLIVGGTDGDPERLAIGDPGQVLTVVDGAPAWDDAPGAFWANFSITDGADDTTLARTTGGTSVVQVWESAALESEAVWTLTLTGETNSASLVANSGGGLTWAGVPLMANPMTSVGDIIIGGTAGAPTRLAAGSEGQVLTLASGSPAWAAVTVNNGNWSGTALAVSNGGTGATDAAGARAALAAEKAAALNTVSTASSDLDAAWASDYTRFTHSAGAKTLNVRANATHAVPTMAKFPGRNAAAEDLTIAPAGGVTINAPAGGTLVIPPHGTFTLVNVATDEWDLFGETVAA